MDDGASVVGRFTTRNEFIYDSTSRYEMRSYNEYGCIDSTRAVIIDGGFEYRPIGCN